MFSFWNWKCTLYILYIPHAAKTDVGNVDIFTRPARAQQVGKAQHGGTGTTPTNETHGLGAMALASLVAAREAAGRPIPELATIVERWSSDPPPMFR